MKHKIICALLCVVMLFSLFSVFAFASYEALSLVDEIENNLPDLELEEFKKHGESVFIGLAEDYDDGHPTLILYFYLSEKAPESINLKFELNAYNDKGEEIELYEYADYGTAHLRASEDGFVKYEFYISPVAAVPDGYREYRFDYITVGNKVFYMDIYYKISYNTDGTYDVKYDVKEEVGLEIYSTDYRVDSTDTKYEYDNIVSVYFSIPEKYQDWYDYLYSVTVEMLKRRTKPIFVSNYEARINDGPGYVHYINEWLERLALVSGESSGNFENHLGSEKYYKYANNIRDNTVGSSVQGTYLLESFSLAFCDPDAESFYDIEIFGEVLENYIKNYSANADFFESAEYNKYVTKNINETWESLNYTSSAGFFDYWADFGFFEAFKYLMLKDNETELYKFFEEHGIDPEWYNFKDEPYLVRVDDTVRNDLSNLESKTFCDKYAIGYDDYEHFKKYCNDNSNVVIYRIDVDNYTSIPVKLYEKTDEHEYTRVYEDIAAGIVQTCVYDDVQVIDITMNRDGEYHSLKTTSNFVNIYPNLEGIEPDSGMPSDKSFWDGLTGFVNLKVFGEEDPWSKVYATVKLFLIVIAIICVVAIAIKLVKIINTIRMNHYLRKQSKKE